MKIRPYGEQGVLVEFKSEITASTNQKVSQLVQLIKIESIEGIKSLIPGYHSLVIYFDPNKIKYQDLESKVELKISSIKSSAKYLESTIKNQCTYILPVCYDVDFGLDLNRVGDRLGMDKEAIIEVHTAQPYTVFSIGFMPGFTYLGPLRVPLSGQRLDSPRTLVKRGAVGIAGSQTGIYPMESPGGWEIIGNCPIPIFMPLEKDPFPFHVGDQIKFKSIDRTTHDELSKKEWVLSEFSQFII